jgi:hypothetical protein
MRLRRAAVFENLNRPRLDEAGAQLALYPTSRRRRLLGVAVLAGGAFIKSGPEVRTPGRHTHEGDGPCEQRES